MRCRSPPRRATFGTTRRTGSPRDGRLERLPYDRSNSHHRPDERPCSQHAPDRRKNGSPWFRRSPRAWQAVMLVEGVSASREYAGEPLAARGRSVLYWTRASAEQDKRRCQADRLASRLSDSDPFPTPAKRINQRHGVGAARPPRCRVEPGPSPALSRQVRLSCRPFSTNLRPLSRGA